MRQAMRERVKLNGSPCNSNGKLFVKELCRNEQILLSGVGTKLHHVSQADPCLLQTTPYLYLFHETLTH